MTLTTSMSFHFLILANTIINGLKTELAYYMAKANGLSLDVDKLDWWKQHETELPLWFSSCISVLLIQPSSAAAERVFSLLTNISFRRLYTNLTIMLQYNHRDSDDS